MLWRQVNYPTKHKLALEHVAEMISDARGSEIEGDNETTFSVTGHSMGGTIVQIVASVFGLNGSSIDGYGTGVVRASAEYKEFVNDLRSKYPEAFDSNTPGIGKNFVSIVEDGSIVSEKDSFFSPDEGGNMQGR